MVAIKKQNLNLKEYKNAILYFFKYCNNQYLGLTKLNKLLYYLDFISYRDRKESITGDIYLHKQFGPIPENIDSVLVELKQEGLIDIKQIAFEETKYKNEFKLLEEPSVNIFDDYEKELLKNICDEFAMWSTDKIVDQTHLEAPWFYSKLFDEVDYEYSKDIEFFLKK